MTFLGMKWSKAALARRAVADAVRRAARLEAANKKLVEFICAPGVIRFNVGKHAHSVLSPVISEPAAVKILLSELSPAAQACYVETLLRRTKLPVRLVMLFTGISENWLGTLRGLADCWSLLPECWQRDLAERRDVRRAGNSRLRCTEYRIGISHWFRLFSYSGSLKKMQSNLLNADFAKFVQDIHTNQISSIDIERRLAPKTVRRSRRQLLRALDWAGDNEQLSAAIRHCIALADDALAREKSENNLEKAVA